MKLFLTACLVLLVASCREKPVEPPEEQFASVWRTTHHYFSIEAYDFLPSSIGERVKEDREVLLSADVTEGEEYSLSFREDGTGIGSGLAPSNQGRYVFGFNWQSSDDELTITLVSTSGFGGVLYTEYISAQSKVIWTIEEQTSNKMVLFFEHWLEVSGIDGSAWSETHTLRYTFERVK